MQGWIRDTEAEAESLREAIDALLGYPIDDLTQCYTYVRAHPGGAQWACMYGPRVDEVDGQTHAGETIDVAARVTLDATWTEVSL